MFSNQAVASKFAFTSSSINVNQVNRHTMFVFISITRSEVYTFSIKIACFSPQNIVKRGYETHLDSEK